MALRVTVMVKIFISTKFVIYESLLGKNFNKFLMLNETRREKKEIKIPTHVQTHTHIHSD